MLPTESLQQWCAAVSDIYLYEDVPVLKNKLDIRDEKTLDLIEAEQSRANMMILYERGFSDFTPAGLCECGQITLKAQRLQECCGQRNSLLAKREF